MGADSKEWLRYAVRDTEVAKLSMDHGYYADCVEHCQQAIEKAMKAQLADGGMIPPKTHNLTELAMRTGVYEKLDVRHKELYQELSMLYTRTRYPDDQRLIELIDLEYCKAALESAKEMIEWTERKLSGE